MAQRLLARLVALSVLALLVGVATAQLPSSSSSSLDEFFAVDAFGSDDLSASWKLQESLPLAPSPSSSPISTPPPRSMTDLEDDPISASLTPSSNSSTPSLSSPAAHSFRPLQAGTAFTAVRMTAMAPFSPRIQPGLMFRTREITYTQIRTNLRIKLGAGYLMLYEGAMTNRSGGPTLAVENDVWVTNDLGATWDLVAGKSFYGTSGPTNAVQANTFVARSGSNNCNDPLSDLIMSLGGIDPVTGNSTTAAYTSQSGVNWAGSVSTAIFSPQRHFSSCDITERGDAYIIGGHWSATNVLQERLLNDVWRGLAVGTLGTIGTWTRVTEAAAFSPREEHLVLVAYSALWKKEILYVIGGRVTCTNPTCYNGLMANDVWASSDEGRSWAVINANPGFPPRWGHGGWVTKDGVLLVWGGLNTPTGIYANTITNRDMWASFNGGYNWVQCNTPNTDWIRGEQGVAVSPAGNMVLVAGYAYTENNVFQVRYNDVWSTNWNVDDSAQVAARCGGVAVPAGGPGIRTWPNPTPVPSNTVTFTALTLRAPWSPRNKPALLRMSTPLTYKTPDGSTASTGPDWLLLYEGMNLVSSNANSNENDVYASMDDGRTWTMISGVSRRGQLGEKDSAYATSSFSGSITSADCEDPLTDDVYSLSGLRWDATQSPAGFYGTNDVWYSSNALVWTKRVQTRNFFEPRSGAECDVGHSHNIVITAGNTASNAASPGLMNDVWVSTSKGVSWQRVAARAPFPARMRHAMQIAYSEYYGVDLIFVVGGQTMVNGVADTLNDVWVSSSGGSSWRQVTMRAKWDKRSGHSIAVTEAGAMLLVGSNTVVATSDMWASLDGGKLWTQCRLQTGQTVMERSPAMQLTADEKLVVGSGYPRTDLWISDQSLADPQRVATLCQGSVPEAGVGLRMDDWEAAPGNGTDSNMEPTASSGLSVGVILLIVVCALVLMAVVWWLWQHQQKTGSWNPLSAQPSSTDAEKGGMTGGKLDSALLGDTAAVSLQ